MHIEGPTGPPAPPYVHIVGPEGGYGGNGGNGDGGGTGGFGPNGPGGPKGPGGPGGKCNKHFFLLRNFIKLDSNILQDLKDPTAHLVLPDHQVCFNIRRITRGNGEI